MVTLLLDSDRLEVALSGTERALSFTKGNVFVPRAQIAKAMLTDDPWIWLRGVPSPGTALPGVIAMGAWKSSTGVDFAVIRGRKPAVVLDLVGHEAYERLVLTTRHGLALVKALKLDAAAPDTAAIEIVSEQPAPTTKSRPRRSPQAAPAT